MRIENCLYKVLFCVPKLVTSIMYRLLVCKYSHNFKYFSLQFRTQLENNNFHIHLCYKLNMKVNASQKSNPFSVYINLKQKKTYGFILILPTA